MNLFCPLCHSKDVVPFYKDRLNHFWQCKKCLGLYRDPTNVPKPADEKARYLTHNNDVNDPGYRKFVSSIVDYILSNFNTHYKGLDYGAGTGPVAAVMLQEAGYSVNLYDPFFHPQTSPLEHTYDFIICCEVMEHFHDPKLEFEKLHALLNPGGALICKTDLYTEDIDFKKWYYKNDPTHVFIYHKNSVEQLAVSLGYELNFLDERTIVFKRPA